MLLRTNRTHIELSERLSAFLLPLQGLVLTSPLPFIIAGYSARGPMEEQGELTNGAVCSLTLSEPPD